MNNKEQQPIWNKPIITRRITLKRIGAAALGLLTAKAGYDLLTDPEGQAVAADPPLPTLPPIASSTFTPTVPPPTETPTLTPPTQTVAQATETKTPTPPSTFTSTPENTATFTSTTTPTRTSTPQATATYTSTPPPTPTPETQVSFNQPQINGNKKEVTPTPTKEPILGQSPTTRAREIPGDKIRLEDIKTGQVITELEVGFMWTTGSYLPMPLGFIREEGGHTYAVVRRESDQKIVRKYLSPEDPWVFSVPWQTVIENYTYSNDVLASIPLDEQHPSSWQLAQMLGDPKVFTFDPTSKKWRHIPNPETFVSYNFDWRAITTADTGFTQRIANLLGDQLSQKSV